MATRVGDKGTQLFVQQLGEEATGFIKACEFVQGNQAKYTLGTAGTESEKLESAFRSVTERIAHCQKSLCANGEILVGEEEKFFALTEMDNDVRTSFQKAIKSLHHVNPNIAVSATEVLSGQKQELTKMVYVYHDGKGDLFIRGENGQVRLPVKQTQTILSPVEFGGSPELSWDRGVPMTKVADHLWQAQIVVKEGATPKYKFLASDCIWQSGGDYISTPGKSQIHIPSFDAKSSSLLVPMDVGFGNKLALFGTGTVKVDGKDVELAWDKGLDLQSFGPSLWALPLSADAKAEFKVCLVKQSGQIVWEEGANRKLATGAEVVLEPKFPGTNCRLVSMETASESLGLHLFERQDELVERRKIDEDQKKAEVKVRQFPKFQPIAGKTFQDQDILQVMEPTDIREIEIDGKQFNFYITTGGKHVFVQEGLKACTAGASAMMILDNGKKPTSAKALTDRDSGTGDTIAEDIRKAGLEPLQTPVKNFKRSFAALRQQILLHGPAYVRTKQGPNWSGHAMTVDEISEDFQRVRIRDPWHGWDFIVKGDAFYKAWCYSLDQCENIDTIVQVKNGVK
ncbi:MAG: hypothetical protein JSS60_01705 [Verrucomicrobia bacterium]|nr:hypothetical protein [Verrucomicrobiota bacterium]